MRILRTTLLTLYGMVIGVTYIAVLAIAFPSSIYFTIILSIIVIAIFSFFGNQLAKTSGMSNRKILFLMPLIPFALLGGIIGFGFMFLVIGVLWPIAAIRGIQGERLFRNMMKSKARYIKLFDLEPRLIAGNGTLIEDTGQKGPYRIWWTEDDLFSFGSPASTNEEFISILKGEEHAFNSRCLVEYFGEETGKALLTNIPAHYTTSGKLAQMFPMMKVAKVIRPLLHLGR
jgi:hypothetical protein